MSTSIIGGSSALNVLVKIAQLVKIAYAKAAALLVGATGAALLVGATGAALLVGATGVGLIGLFQGATGVATTVSCMGLGISGVRSIADAAASGDQERLGRVVRAFRLTLLVFGLLGAVPFFALRRPIAVATFGDAERANAVGLLAVIPLLMALGAGYSALLRGMRRIGFITGGSGASSPAR